MDDDQHGLETSGYINRFDNIVINLYIVKAELSSP